MGLSDLAFIFSWPFFFPKSRGSFLIKKSRRSSFILFLGYYFLGFCWLSIFAFSVQAQQTLGGITGTVSDTSGGVLPDTAVSIVNDQTKLSRTQSTSPTGAYDFA